MLWMLLLSTAGIILSLIVDYCNAMNMSIFTTSSGGDAPELCWGGEADGWPCMTPGTSEKDWKGA